ncbi:glycosyltransferase family 2 protein [Marinicrinis lubricantis]|uniref:Glycosyltransferase n=1 Tax=Marinicrinis lubricantis TaxID=2086470 RepID=A0ABW1INP1_9BACL
MELWISAFYIAFRWFGFSVFFYMITVMVFYTFLMLASAIQLRRNYHMTASESYEDMLRVSYTKPISILVPAFNEEAGIYGSIRSLLSVQYPEYEIIVINDGSSDRTLEKMIEQFQMVKIHHVIRKQLDTEPVRAVYQSTIHNHLFMIDKENGGKADALNAGINFSRYPYFCSLDGDSVLERTAFLKVMKPILESNDDVLASGGSIRIANGCKIESGSVVKVGLSKKPLVIMQEIEYLRAFLMGRIGLSRHNLLLIVSGAFGVFNKYWVVEAGGYLKHTVGEDMELIVRLHRMNRDRQLGKRIIYIPDPVCWTEAPESMKYLRRQRNRWHRGLTESLWKHKAMLFNPKYGTIGTVSMPYFLIIEWWSPVVELCAYILLLSSVLIGGISEFTILLFIASILYGSVFSMGAVLLEEWTLKKYPHVTDILRLFFYALTETLWYRPLTVIWRCQGIVQQLLGKKSWGEMKRKGVSS